MDPTHIFIALVAGIALGLIHFGGLWWTVRQVPTARRPGTLLLVSFVIRTAVMLAGTFWVMDGRWERLAACMVGFLVARVILTRRWGPEYQGSN
jgi:F1F0 ATPase subunit 2